MGKEKILSTRILTMRRGSDFSSDWRELKMLGNVVDFSRICKEINSNWSIKESPTNSFELVCHYSTMIITQWPFSCTWILHKNFTIFKCTGFIQTSHHWPSFMNKVFCLCTFFSNFTALSKYMLKMHIYDKPNGIINSLINFLPTQKNKYVESYNSFR